MPVPVDSRFGFRPVLEVVAPDGTLRHVLGLGLGNPSEGHPGQGRHRVVQGQGIDLVAQITLGDERLWWRILDVNPLQYPLDLVPGQVLRLPDPVAATRANRARAF